MPPARYRQRRAPNKPPPNGACCAREAASGTHPEEDARGCAGFVGRARDKRLQVAHLVVDLVHELLKRFHFPASAQEAHGSRARFNGYRAGRPRPVSLLAIPARGARRAGGERQYAASRSQCAWRGPFLHWGATHDSWCLKYSEAMMLPYKIGFRFIRSCSDELRGAGASRAWARRGQGAGCVRVKGHARTMLARRKERGLAGMFGDAWDCGSHQLHLSTFVRAAVRAACYVPRRNHPPRRCASATLPLPAESLGQCGGNSRRHLLSVARDSPFGHLVFGWRANLHRNKACARRTAKPNRRVKSQNTVGARGGCVCALARRVGAGAILSMAQGIGRPGRGKPSNQRVGERAAGCLRFHDFVSKRA